MKNLSYIVAALSISIFSSIASASDLVCNPPGHWEEVTKGNWRCEYGPSDSTSPVSEFEESVQNIDYGPPKWGTCSAEENHHGCIDVWVDSNYNGNPHHGYNGCQCPDHNVPAEMNDSNFEELGSANNCRPRLWCP